jgi:hypothetical protein
MRDIVPRNQKVTCYRDGRVIDLQLCRVCEHYEFDGAVAALGEFSFTYDTSFDVQSPHLCMLEGVGE